MSESYWKQKWATDDIGFHLEETHPQLVKFLKVSSGGKVMVPLCGKSKDLLYLRAQGFEVVGVEFSKIACEAFFNENKIQFEKSDEGLFTVYAGEGITIWCGDFFLLPEDAWKGCTVVYDRAAMIALPEKQRVSYSTKVRGGFFCEPKLKSILLVSLTHAGSDIEGPPFSVTEEEIRRLYGQRFQIEKLSEEVEKELTAREKYSAAAVLESVYQLVRLV